MDTEPVAHDAFLTFPFAACVLKPTCWCLRGEGDSDYFMIYLMILGLQDRVEGEGGRFKGGRDKAHFTENSVARTEFSR